MSQEVTEVLRHLNGNLQPVYLLGQGAFGQVYTAEHHFYKTKIAVKIEWREVNGAINDHGFSMLLREAKILIAIWTKLRTPSVKEIKSTSKFHYLVMERLDPNVNSLLRNCDHRFSLKTTLMIFDQAVSRLETLHGSGFLHRDVKPYNFVVGNDQSQEHVYVIDFTISKAYTNRDGKTWLT
jgi:serine/threonine protein kinase